MNCILNWSTATLSRNGNGDSVDEVEEQGYSLCYGLKSFCKALGCYTTHPVAPTCQTPSFSYVEPQEKVITYLLASCLVVIRKMALVILTECLLEVKCVVVSILWPLCW